MKYIDFEITIHDLSHNGVCYIDFNNGVYLHKCDKCGYEYY